jgi:hypothetical protein
LKHRHERDGVRSQWIGCFGSQRLLLPLQMLVQVLVLVRVLVLVLATKP